MRISPKKAALLLGALGLVGASGALAEVGKSGDLLVAVHAVIRPRSLPSAHPAPVGVQISAKIKTTDRSVPPALKRIDLKLTQRVIFQTAGLPYCSLARLESLSAVAARRACGPAILGHGEVFSRTYLPGVTGLAQYSHTLIFNGRIGSRPAILALVTSKPPMPFKYVIRFEVTKIRGIFGTELHGTIPPTAPYSGEVLGFGFSLKRLYTLAGHRVSVFSEACNRGFAPADFPFAAARFAFADGKEVSSTYFRECTKRNPSP
jgi:hypothetical protein